MNFPCFWQLLENPNVQIHHGRFQPQFPFMAEPRDQLVAYLGMYSLVDTVAKFSSK